jgi:hypothetical protein
VLERRLRVDRTAVDMDLEVEVTTDRAGVPRLPHSPDALAGPDPPAAAHPRRTAQMGVEVAALLALAVDQ